MMSCASLLEQFEAHFRALPFLCRNNTLFTPLQYTFSKAGKRLRPLCCLATHQSFSALNEDSFTIATALELFHNFTLIHDDIIDNAPIRRGRPSVFNQFGLNAGILSGDALLILAYQQIEDVAPVYKSKILSLLNQTAIEVCLGQQMDIDLEQQKYITLDTYIEMIRLKTAVLIACSFKMGGILAGLSQKDNAILYDIGKNLGIAFQIQDDLLDVYGEQQQVGKGRGTDIINNKKTYLLTYALTYAPPPLKKQLEQALTLKDAPKKIKTITSIFDTLHIQQHAQEALNAYHQKCLGLLEHLSAADTSLITHILNQIQLRRS